MNHYQKEFKCNICGREFIVDITSIGTQHQTIQAVTCKECAKKVGGKIMGTEKEEIEFDSAPELLRENI